MSLGLLGKKIGMSNFYNSKGDFIPVTLVNVFNNYLVKSFNNFFQIVFGNKNILNFKNPLFFHYLKYNVFFGGILKEFKVNNFDFNNFNSGDNIPMNIFYINQKINVLSKSIGKGFSGVMKRFNFKSIGNTHGNSKSHRKSGSIGMNQDPGRVLKGKKMAGHLGCKYIFIKNLKIINIDFDYNIFFIKGSISGSLNSYIYIFPSN